MRAFFLAAILSAVPLAAQEETETEPVETPAAPPAQSQTVPGTSGNTILPGLGTVPSIQERRPSPRNPTYQPPVRVPGFDQSKIDPGALFLFSGGDFDVNRWLNMRKSSGRPSRSEQAPYDELPNGGKSRVETEKLYLEQFGLSAFPYRTHSHEEDESASRRFSIVFLVSLPITMAASYGLFRLGKSAAGQGNAFSRGQTAGMVALGLGLSAGIGWYDSIENEKMQRVSNRPPDQIAAAFTMRF